MPIKITDAGRALIAAKLAAAETVDITRVKFGDPTHADPNNPPVPLGSETDVDSIVHTVNGGITAGVVNQDQVAYTAFLDASVGDFDITQVGFFHVDGPSETLIMLANVPPVRKTANVSNNYKHTEILSIQQAAEATGVVIDAATWQLDHTARFRTVENEIKFDVARLLGRFAALSGALLVSEIAPTLREDAEALTGWAASSGSLALDAADKTEGANSVEISGHAADATLTKTLGAAQDWSAANGVLVDVLSDLASNIAFFIEDSAGNLSFWNLVSQVAFFEHEIILAAADGNNGTDADLSDVLKFGLEGLDNAVVYNIDNIRTARLNDFALAAGDAFLEGISRNYPLTTHAAHLNDWNADATAPPVLAPPGGGTRNDKVWLDVWVEGNGSTVAVRAKLTVDAAAQPDYVDGNGVQHYVEEIAAVLRTTSERITTAMITDSRRVLPHTSPLGIIAKHVADEIAAILDAAPGALDTLNELAAALGDDANFAATMTTALAGKQATSEKGVAGGYAELDGSVFVPVARIPDLDAAKIATGNFAEARIPFEAPGPIGSTTPGTGKFTNAEVTGAAPSPPAANTIYKDNVAAAWINFNGIGTIAIRDSFNIASITDNAPGDYTITFDTDFADANYSYTGNSEAEGSTHYGLLPHATASSKSYFAKSAGSIQIVTVTTASGNQFDMFDCNLHFFGAQ